MRAVSLFPVLLVVVVGTLCVSASIAINGSEHGRRFDGIGGLSGGGATSRFLPSYQKPYIDEIFDYLFKPNFGAALHICKVEIGGDSQTTDGTEPSHMHSRHDLNFNRGYEWWIMQEAKKRNPDVLLYALSWGVPGWIGNRSFFSQDNIDYHIKWVEGAKSVYNLDIDYIGVWNERAWDADWIIHFRTALDTAGFRNTRIVAADALWDIADTMLVNSTLKAAVDVIGAHYPGTQSTKNATKLDTPLWSSEDFSTFADSTGGGCWARILNQNYAGGYMTGTIAWNLIAAYYDNLPFPGDGLMWASNPWSGHYDVPSPIWVTAHTTQFVQPGWRYLAHGSGVGYLSKGGSYVTLVPSNNTNDFSLIIETFSHNNSVCIRPNLYPYNVAPQNVTFTLNNLPTNKPLHVWKTHLEQSGENSYFEKIATITPNKGQFSLQLDVDSIWTISTLTGQKKGSHPTPPAATLFPLSYSDDFEKYPYDQEADYFIDQTGVFEIYKGSKSKVMRQMGIPPITWCEESSGPISLIGEFTAVDQSMYVDALIETDGGQIIVGLHVQEGGCGNSYANGYFFTVNVRGAWTISNGRTVVESGTLATPFGVNQWHTIHFYTQGAVICASVDGAATGCAKNNTLYSGFASIGSSWWNNVQFDNFKLNSTVPASCGAGDYIKIDSCVGGKSNTKWKFYPDGSIRPQSDATSCLDVFGTDSTGKLPAARLRKCTTPLLDTQKWQHTGSTLLARSGQCLDIPQKNVRPCSNARTYKCNGNGGQVWSYLNGQLTSGLAPNLCLATTA